MHLTVHINSQTMVLHQNNGPERTYLISTASKGVGQQRGSWQTPLGAHVIRAKIGTGLPLNAVLIGRRFTGEVYSEKLHRQYPLRKDWVLSRILWLSGLEPGFNRLGDVDTMRRYIYIHGAVGSAVMGKPGSRGCIRMRGSDIIDLYDRVEAGMKVTIQMT